MLEARDPVGLVARLEGGEVASVELVTSDTVDTADRTVVELFGRSVSASARTSDAVVTVFRPVPTLVLYGSGAIASAVADAAALLGWRVRPTSDVPTAKGLLARAARLDSVLVIGHDVETSGAVLEAALASPIGYLGALGSRRTQQARADWLAYRGVTDVSRIHGPAGLDIGARTPAEIAVAILAEALAAHAPERADQPTATAGTT
jgi:xanthine dehydrogenase accessory factor